MSSASGQPKYPVSILAAYTLKSIEGGTPSTTSEQLGELAKKLESVRWMARWSQCDSIAGECENSTGIAFLSHERS